MNKFVRRTFLCSVLISCAQVSSAGNVFTGEVASNFSDSASASTLMVSDPTKDWATRPNSSAEPSNPISGFALVFAGLIGLGVLRNRLKP